MSTWVYIPNVSSAEAKLNEALIVSQTSSNQTTETYCLYNLGLLYLTTDPAKSKDYLDRAHKVNFMS